MIEQIAAIVTALVVIGVSTAVGRKLVSRSRLSQAYSYALWGASAAEEMFADGNGPVKYEYVRDLLLKRFGVSEEEARMLVNAAVKGLRVTGVKQVPIQTPLAKVVDLAQNAGSPPPATPAA